MANNLLLVPIQADSLFLDKDQLLSEPLADFSRLPFFNGKRDVNPDVAYVSENFVSPPLQNQNLRFRKGLHLHWALPGAFTQGVHTAAAHATGQDTFQYPPVPNRWYIQRQLGNSETRWLIESNFLWPDEAIYEDLGEVYENLKKALRLVRAFEALPEGNKSAVQVSRMREVEQILESCASLLEEHLAKPEYAFFDQLLVELRAWAYRLKTAEARTGAGMISSDVALLRPGLEALLDAYFDRRKDSISYPIAPGAIRAPKDIDPALSDIKPLIADALRTANRYLSLWNSWTSGKENRNDDLEQLKADFVPKLITALTRWLEEPGSTGLKFLETAPLPFNSENLNAFNGRILAKPVELLYQESLTSTVKIVSFEQFDQIKQDDLRKIELAFISRLHPWPEIVWLREPYAAPVQVFVFQEAFAAQLAFLKTKTTLGPADIEVVADALLGILKKHATMAISPRTQQPYRHLGRVIRQRGNAYREDRNTYEYLDNLTAIGYGEPSFAAFYPNCHSVFGFHDGEIEAGDQPTYHLAGWYARPQDEFLAYWQNAEPGIFIKEILSEKLNWILPDGAAELSPDTRIACFSKLEHGTLGAPTNDQPEALAPQATITLANTGREALAALLAHRVAAEIPEDERARRIAKIEDQLESIFFMDDLDQQQLDIGPRFRETRHAQGFNAEPGERRYEIKLENVEIAAGTDGANPPAPAPKMPADIAVLLQNLNARQRDFDQACFHRDSLREQLFVDWYKYMLSAYPPQDSIVDYPDMDEVLYFIREYDIKPLHDLLYQTGQHPAHPSPGELPNLHDSLLDAYRKLQTEAEDPNSALQQLNHSLAADIQRHDLTDWAKLIHHLSQPALPNALQPLFGAVLGPHPFSDTGRALLHFQQLKKDVLAALNAGWRGGLEFVQFFLGRFGAVPEAPNDDQIGHDHIHNWNGLLNLLSQQNPPKVQLRVDALKSNLPNGFEQNLAAYLQGEKPQSAALEASEANLIAMLQHLREVVGNGILASQNRQDLAEALHGALRAAPRFVLQQNSGPRFWQPKEPTVLIAGEIARSGKRFGTDVDAPLVFKPWQIARIPENLPAGIRTLVDTNQPPEPERGYNFSGGAPWNPFLLEWSVELCPLQEHGNARDGDYQADYVTHHYELPLNAVDLAEKTRGRSIRARNPNIYLGRSFLSSQAFRSMEDKLKPYLAENTPGTEKLDDPVFAAQKADVRLQELKGKILSQALSGFNNAMLMLQENFQLPVDDPIGFSEYKSFTNEVAALIGNSTLRSPNPLTDFSPIRTGRLLLNKLRLVDTFGRVADLPVDTGHVLGSSLGAVSEAVAADGKTPCVQLQVPPRLAQPARLHFRWLSAEPDPALPGDIIPESVNSPASTPVCGWLMANQLDRSLVVFDSRGRSLGAVDADGDLVRWRPAPGWESLTDPNAIANPHLRKVAAHLLTQNGAFMEKFMDGTNAVLRTIEPETFEQQQALALLMGRPMAVVRANIDLELKGVPAVHHGWDAFYRDRKGGGVERETDGYMQVRYPIRIGAEGQLNDGLVGYWLEDQIENLQGNFFLNTGQGATQEVPINYLDARNTPISQSLAPDDPDQTVCLLLDPRAGVHAFSGILPAKVLDIPAEQYLDALQAIDITFLTAPILTPTERITVPRSLESGYEWQWIEQTALKTSPTDKGQWIEIREYPTMQRSRFLQIFSEILFVQLLQTHWLDNEKRALPPEKRPPLAPEFTRLNELLAKAIRDAAQPVLRSSDLNAAGGMLLDTLLLDPRVRWLEPAPTEGPEPVYRILPKEKRGATTFANDSAFAGFEARVDAILNTAHAGFATAAGDGRFFNEPVWIREGWLKLQKT